MEEILKLENVCKDFSKGFKLKNINISLYEGEIVGYLGPNGAGKTTTIKLIMNALKRDSGNIYLFKKNIEKNDVTFRKHIGFMPESGVPYEFLTAREYLNFLASVYGIESSKRKLKIEELLNAFNLSDQKKQMRTFSKGMKQKVLFMSAIIHNPEILILDEPFNAIEPSTAMLMKNILFEMKSEGKSILFSSHILEIVEKIATRVILINRGEMVGEGMVSDIKDKGGLEEFFSVLTDSSKIDDNTERIIQVIKS